MPAPIAHLAIGYGLYRALRSADAKGALRRALHPQKLLLPACLFFSILPDSDSALGIIFGRFGSFHNQWSHSLFFWIPPSMLLSAIIYLFYRDRRQALAWGALCIASCIIHVLMDFACQGRGVMLFWPFSPERWSSPILIFYGVRWSDGVWSLRHFNTLLNELIFILVTLPPILYLKRARPLHKASPSSAFV